MSRYAASGEVRSGRAGLADENPQGLGQEVGPAILLTLQVSWIGIGTLIGRKWRKTR